MNTGGYVHSGGVEAGSTFDPGLLRDVHVVAVDALLHSLGVRYIHICIYIYIYIYIHIYV